MTTKTTDQNISALTAEQQHGEWAVRDSAGGVWHPDDDTAAEIAASEDPAATAVAICDAEPMRGTWHS